MDSPVPVVTCVRRVPLASRSSPHHEGAVCADRGWEEAACWALFVADDGSSERNEALVELLGEEAAAVVVERDPRVLAASEGTTREAMDALVEVLRGREEAVTAVQQAPELLMAGGVRRAMAALVEELGSEEALSLARRSAVVLTASSLTETMAALVRALGGRKEALCAVRLNAKVLVTSPRVMEEAMAALVEVMGSEEAAAAAAVNPYVLTADGDVIRQAAPALVEVLGRETAEAAIARSPSLLMVACPALYTLRPPLCYNVCIYRVTHCVCHSVSQVVLHRV